tara:strand:- start:258 stop:398 length:141 start_codon:yes stop_codon:yes gene_type:complete
MGDVWFPEKLVAAQKDSFMVFALNYFSFVYMAQLSVYTESDCPDIW